MKPEARNQISTVVYKNGYIYVTEQPETDLNNLLYSANWR